MANAFFVGCGKVDYQTDMKEQPHIGELIKAQLHKQEHTNEWLARQLSCNIRTVTKIFHKQTIDTQQLMRISEILEFDFFKIYSDNFNNR